jgi:hypothetical protein
MKHDFGYPFGIQECDNPEKVHVAPASCPACEKTQQLGHFLCVPGWKNAFLDNHYKLIAGPVCEQTGWCVLLEDIQKDFVYVNSLGSELEEMKKIVNETKGDFDWEGHNDKIGVVWRFGPEISVISLTGPTIFRLIWPYIEFILRTTYFFKKEIKPWMTRLKKKF